MARISFNLQIASDQFRLSPWTPPAIECKIACMISSRSDCHESRSIHHRGDFMNGSKGIGRCRVLASTAMLFGAIFTILLLPAYAQQDVNPDWYDPAPNAAVVHPAQPAAAVHSSQPPVATHRYQQTIRSASTASDAGKLRVKGAQVQSGHNPAGKSDGTPSGELVAIASRDPR
jgi:hypothetical protein